MKKIHIHCEPGQSVEDDGKAPNQDIVDPFVLHRFKDFQKILKMVHPKTSPILSHWYHPPELRGTAGRYLRQTGLEHGIWQLCGKTSIFYEVFRASILSLSLTLNVEP